VLALQLLAAGLCGAGCRISSTPISRIARTPGRYQGLEVTVKGRVEGVRWIPQVGAIGFDLIEEKDSLLVLTLGDAPPEGKTVRLHGEIARRFPVDGARRVVLLYRAGLEPAEPMGKSDTR
jgi:hypothetical protein